MAKILREAQKAPVAEVAKKHGISNLTLYAPGASALGASAWASMCPEASDPAE